MPAKTTIQWRRDTAANWTTANPTLAAGEAGFETDTGKFKIGTGSTAWSSLAYFATGGGTVGGSANQVIYKDGTSTATGSANLTFNGTTLSANLLAVTQSSGDEGGQIDLTKAATNTTLTTGVSIDVYQNRLRFFETGGSSRGFYLDISTGAAGAGTDLNADAISPLLLMGA